MHSAACSPPVSKTNERTWAGGGRRTQAVDHLARPNGLAAACVLAAAANLPRETVFGQTLEGGEELEDSCCWQGASRIRLSHQPKRPAKPCLFALAIFCSRKLSCNAVCGRMSDCLCVYSGREGQEIQLCFAKTVLYRSIAQNFSFLASEVLL